MNPTVVRSYKVHFSILFFEKSSILTSDIKKTSLENECSADIVPYKVLKITVCCGVYFLWTKVSNNADK